MNNTETVEFIKSNHPRLVYLSGKTCTGKTTFADLLCKFDYEKIELDAIVVESVVKKFGVQSGDGFRTAYRGLGPVEQTDSFINAAKAEIQSKLQASSLVVEGAIADPEILRKLFSDDLSDFVFIYFHPVDAEAYGKRILQRFTQFAKVGTAGLPKDFWEMVQKADFDEFIATDIVNQSILQAIKAYVDKSMKESVTRLEGFRALFAEIEVVEV